MKKPLSKNHAIKKYNCRPFGWTTRLLLTISIHVTSVCFTYSQSSPAISYSPIGSLHIDSSTAWIARIFDARIDSSIQIVGLGEVTHGGFEPFAWKAKMIQYLVEKKGYRNILFELADFDCMAIRNYLADHDARSLAITDSLVKKLRISRVAISVLSDLFRWLKSYNLRHPRDKVQISGFDVSQSHEAFCNYFLFNFIFRYTADSAQTIVKRWISSHASDSMKLYDISSWFSNHKDVVAASLGKKAFDRLDFQVRNQINGLQDLFRTYTYRDSIMEQNIQYLAGNGKAVLWAHNGHLYKGPPFMGQYLDRDYQSGYFVVLTDYSKEAAVTVVDDAKKIWQSGYFYTRVFQPFPFSTPVLILNKFGVGTGIFLHDEVAAHGIADRINCIPLFGEQFLVGSQKAFDALVIFYTITTIQQPGIETNHGK